jgi:hypothetical protein
LTNVKGQAQTSTPSRGQPKLHRNRAKTHITAIWTLRLEARTFHAGRILLIFLSSSVQSIYLHTLSKSAASAPGWFKQGRPGLGCFARKSKRPRRRQTAIRGQALACCQTTTALAYSSLRRRVNRCAPETSPCQVQAKQGDKLDPSLCPFRRNPLAGPRWSWEKGDRVTLPRPRVLPAPRAGQASPHRERRKSGRRRRQRIGSVRNQLYTWAASVRLLRMRNLRPRRGGQSMRMRSSLRRT